MSFLLDTNILSAHLKRPGGLTHRFIQHGGRLFTSSICLAELYVWAFGKADITKTMAVIEQMLKYEVTAISFNDDAAREYARLRRLLKPLGIPVSPPDLFIAAVAMSSDLTLVTHNTADFERIPDLRLVDWLAN